MVINDNNSQINSFIKGMNSDTAYDQIENTLYVFGQNIRITKNQSLGGSSDYTSTREGIVAPIIEGVSKKLNFNFDPAGARKILSIKSIDNIGVVIFNPGGTKSIEVYKFEINQDTDNITALPTLIWSCQNVWTGDVPANISTVLYKELDNVIKLYIATGEHPIITLRVDGSNFSSQINKSIDDLINNRIVPEERVCIKNIITGRLLTSQVQYTYRYYNKYGNSTQLAPLTNKIQVIDSSRSKEIGNAENTETSIGFMLSIDSTAYRSKFDRIQVFRLQYIKPGEDAEVSLIYDDKIGNSDEFILNDVGIDPLQLYTIEEFSAMQGLILIPQVIELNLEYMFCGNIKDDTIIKDLYVTADNANIDLVKTKVILDEDHTSLGLYVGHIPTITTNKFSTLGTEIVNHSDNDAPIMTVSDYLEQRGIYSEDVTATYNDLFTSSLLRSLRRGESYKYAIIFYDKYGRRSDVQPLTVDDIEIPTVNNDNNPYFTRDENTGLVEALPMGVKITLPTLSGKYVDDGKLLDIIGCQIVRRSSSEIYQNTLLQVALARPILQGLLDTTISNPEQATQEDIAASAKDSPFYPTGLLSVLDFKISPSYYIQALLTKDAVLAKTKNNKLFQAFSSEIDFRRDDVLSKLSYSDLKIHSILYVNGIYGCYENSTCDNEKDLFQSDNIVNRAVQISANNGVTIWRNCVLKLKIDEKQAFHWIFDYCIYGSSSDTNEHSIKQIKDVKMSDWDSGFSDVTYQDEKIYTAIKKYRSFTTNIDSYLYNNWVSFCKYDLRAGNEFLPNVEWGDSDESLEFLATQEDYRFWLEHDDLPRFVRNGYIGPGPSCFLISTADDLTQANGNGQLRTIVCNITHTPKLSNVQSTSTEQYFGFGNYFPLEYVKHEGDDNPRLYIKGTEDRYMVVFDGDIYITPHEITTQFKCYDFESIDTLQSTQITNYIPLESKVNTYFDYGMNLRNTNSENLLYEPGSIDGVTTQERPLHQYNMIYSDNDASNDVFTLISTDDNETNNFKQRAYYSDLKTNGEFIDNFLIFKAASFIDVDSRYGLITNLITDKNTLYYWQDCAFGKFSVNERSLVNDQNNNTIMLGQAGILSRCDYLSTKYGMRLQDMCAKTTDSGLFWVDINNKAVVGLLGGQVVNYGERVGVQNIINDKIATTIPQVDYDLQNDELVCKCLASGLQIIFNTKYNIATSIYTREYDRMFYIKNHLYSIDIRSLYDFYITKCNYIKKFSGYSYITPLILEFVVNPSASVTKVFDSQQIIPIKRGLFSLDSSSVHIMDSVSISFHTDINDRQTAISMEATKGNTNPMSPYYNITNPVKMEPYSDREGNIIYNIPRYDDLLYGNRIRGKWMKVSIVNEAPTDLFTISHMITKFRQSYS